MISFVLTLKRLLTGLFHAFKLKNFQVFFVLIVLLLVSGTIFYTTEENLAVIDALYFCITTLSTVGHPDFMPKTGLGKIFTMIYIVVGTGLFMGMLSYVAYGVVQSNQKDGDIDTERDRFKKKAKHK
ncbi:MULTISPECIES: potassium channel family protein [Paenibacillus]|uniref:CHASE3 domain sensor protein n=1 Tax=Paenibacillus favisporus TaxID=221028 RepID=A0ABV2EZ15_9BACL|nr:MULTISPECIES: potassium channel family protein [Paenibacillus]MCM2998882.1 potassium channel family protein [Paenibacillus cellulositrophicus]RED39920.1 ion channel [Paenibacillus sp. VMFN-D1]